MNQKLTKYRNNLKTLGVLLTTLAGSGFLAQAQTTNVDTLEQENQELRKRLDKLENLMVKEGITPSKETADPPVAAMSSITLSGFVTTSYFYDVASTKDVHPVGYLWNTALNQFTINKIKLTLASPAVDKEKWDAAYRVSLIYGQDSKIVDSSSGYTGFDALREAYVELNIPIGTGLDVRAGDLISLLNYESGDGGAANDNFSQGYQWWYTGNGPAGAIQLGYDFNDMFSIKARLQNGLYTGELDSGSKTFLGGFYVKPTKAVSLAFLGFAGRQEYGEPDPYLDGLSFIGSIKLTEKNNLTLATEADYFHFSPSVLTTPGAFAGASHGDFWSIGAWLTADLTPTVSWALRADFLDDPTGFGTIINSPNPAVAEGLTGGGFPFTIYSSGAGQELSSVTLTLDYKPVPSIKIQPEIRWNHSTFNGAFAGKSDQVIVGMGASYLF